MEKPDQALFQMQEAARALERKLDFYMDYAARREREVERLREVLREAYSVLVDRASTASLCVTIDEVLHWREPSNEQRSQPG